MKRTKTRTRGQYTLRNVPAELDRELRRRARAEAKSLNQVVLEALARGAGVGNGKPVYTDLDFLIGTWEHDPAVDAALAAQRVVDEEMWR